MKLDTLINELQKIRQEHFLHNRKSGTMQLPDELDVVFDCASAVGLIKIKHIGYSPEFGVILT